MSQKFFLPTENFYVIFEALIAIGVPGLQFDATGIILSHEERSVIVMDEWQEDKEIKSANPRDQFTWEDVNIYI